MSQEQIDELTVRIKAIDTKLDAGIVSGGLDGMPFSLSLKELRKQRRRLVAERNKLQAELDGRDYTGEGFRSVQL